jgi:hypothetical protein
MHTQREAMVAQLALEKQHLTAFPQEARVRTRVGATTSGSQRLHRRGPPRSGTHAACADACARNRRRPSWRRTCRTTWA